MRKDLTPLRVTKKQASSKARMRWVLFTSLLVFSGSVIFIGYPYGKEVVNLLVKTDYSASIKKWLTDRKHRLHQGVVTVKQLAARQSDPDPQIHFEFYTTLPNLQVTVPKLASGQEGEAKSKKAASHPFWADSSELERELSSHIKQNEN